MQMAGPLLESRLQWVTVLICWIPAVSGLADGFRSASRDHRNSNSLRKLTESETEKLDRIRDCEIRALAGALCASLRARHRDGARTWSRTRFLQLCRNASPELRPRVAQWLYTVCRNRAIDVLRKEQTDENGKPINLAIRPPGIGTG